MLSARGSNRYVRRRQKRPLLRQHFLKASPGPAWAKVVVAELLLKLDLAAFDASCPALYLCF
jgi:hypothetical protein